MRWTRCAAAALCVVAVSAALASLSCTTVKQEAKSSPEDARAAQVKRGEYLVTIMSCNDCHTPAYFYGAPDYDRRLSGSEMGWLGPWGVSFARNLTPDVETGLGAWSDTAVVTAIRSGLRPDGRVLNPPMPWENFGGLTDEDAYAIVAYLRTLPPVSHKVPDVIPPGSKLKAAAVVFPPPPAWDTPKPPTPPAGK